MYPGALLSADDYRRVLLVLEEAERSASLDAFRARTLQALDDHLGYPTGAFFTSPGPAVGEWDPRGAVHGLSERSAEHVYARLDRERRPRADVIIGRDGVTARLSARIDPGLHRVGFLVLLGDRFGGRDRARLVVLRPHLSNLLRRHLDAGEPAVGAAGLTVREAEVAVLVATGRSTHEMAADLGITEDTVRRHVSRTLRKLRLRGRTQLAAVWLRRDRHAAR